MQKESSKEKIVTILFFGVVFILYALFPSHNNSGDAWSCAADVKFGNDLFSPHHLLYTVTIYIFELITGIQDILWLGIFCNSVFAVLSLIVLFQILKLLSANWKRSLLLTAVVAFSFGFWRFATENETYIIPVFFSLLGSLCFIRAFVAKKYSTLNVLLSGLFATIACLYHQIHIFWFIGLLLGWALIDGRVNLKRGLFFASTFIIAPVAYFMVIICYLHQGLNWHNITHFVFHDYYIGAAGSTFGFTNIFLGIINFIRTFFQVHGQMRLIVVQHTLWLLPGILALGLVLFATVLIFRSRAMTIPISSGFSNLKLSNLNIIIQVHIFIFILQLLFAIYNIGNAEFMVMLPALAAIILINARFIPSRSIVFVTYGLLIWNFAYGIFPNNHFHFNADDKVTRFIIDHPKDKFVVAQPATVLNMYYYQKGHWPVNTWASPGYYQLHGTLQELQSKIDSTLKAGGNVFTDCTGRPEITSRESMLYGSNAFFAHYHLKDTVAIFETDAGKHVVYRVH